MRTLKYIVRADGTGKVFDKSAIHAFQVCGCPFPDCLGRAVSAGFVDVEDSGEARTYGESTTLGVKSRPEDIEIIRDLLTQHNSEV